MHSPTARRRPGAHGACALPPRPPLASLCPRTQTSSTQAVGQWAALGSEGAFDPRAFKQQLDIKITKYEDYDMEFELKGVSCAVRRAACVQRRTRGCVHAWVRVVPLCCARVARARALQVANSLRRIMISEAPTMAIEHVYIINNTSVIQVRRRGDRCGLSFPRARRKGGRASHVCADP